MSLSRITPIRRTNEGDKKDCFPRDAIITVMRGGKEMDIFMKDLKVADKVKTKSGFQDVYMFSHMEPDTVMKCMEIKTESRKLVLSHGHFMLVHRDGKAKMIQAKSVKDGDVVFVDNPESGLVQEHVTSINMMTAKGKYAPFTEDGTIIVNGIVCSCFENSVPHDVAQFFLYPVRLWYWYHPDSLATFNKANEEGVPCWAAWLRDYIVPLLPTQAVE